MDTLFFTERDGKYEIYFLVLKAMANVKMQDKGQMRRKWTKRTEGRGTVKFGQTMRLTWQQN